LLAEILFFGLDIQLSRFSLFLAAKTFLNWLFEERQAIFGNCVFPIFFDVRKALKKRQPEKSTFSAKNMEGRGGGRELSERQTRSQTHKPKKGPKENRCQQRDLKMGGGG
jgi:hypothetical protein